MPAGDIGVGGREIGYLFGQYKKLRNEFTGVLTGKGINWSGSRIREEATGYGLVYFVEEMLHTRSNSMSGKVVTISGSGNVAQFAAEKAMLMGGKVVTFSDSDGFVYDPEGVTGEKLAFVKELKNVRRGRIAEYAKQFKCEYYAGKRPWGVKCDVALPCATQNEFNGGGGQDAGRERLHLRRRRGQHAVDPGSGRSLSRPQDPVRPRQGRQRRRRVRQRPGNDAKQHPPAVDQRRGGQAVKRDHEGHP